MLGDIRERMIELLVAVDQPDFVVSTWLGGTVNPVNLTTIDPYVQYHPAVNALLLALDDGKMPSDALEEGSDPENLDAINAENPDEVLEYLRNCARSERFVPGKFGALIESGEVPELCRAYIARQES